MEVGMSLLELKGLKAKVEDKEILKGVDLNINKGEVHVIMGPNGAGKSTLASVLVGHPKYEVSGGNIVFDGEEINESGVDERAQKGMFLSFQYPEEIPGLTVEDFLRSAKEAVTGEKQYFMQFHQELVEKMEKLHINPEYADRHLNVGFSGGEKKKNEILQMAVLNPRLAFLDETDSGLDIDALKIVAKGVNALKSKFNAVVLVTHYQRLLDYIQPDFVHVIYDGKIIKSGDKTLALELEHKGYDWLIK